MCPAVVALKALVVSQRGPVVAVGTSRALAFEDISQVGWAFPCLGLVYVQSIPELTVARLVADQAAQLLH